MFEIGLSHTAQLWFCFKLARIVKDLKHVQKTAQVSCCSKLASKQSAELSISCVKKVKKTTTRQNILNILPKAYEEKGCATINLPKLVCVDNNI